MKPYPKPKSSPFACRPTTAATPSVIDLTLAGVQTACHSTTTAKRSAALMLGQLGTETSAPVLIAQSKHAGKRRPGFRGSCNSGRAARSSISPGAGRGGPSGLSSLERMSLKNAARSRTNLQGALTFTI